MEVPIDQVREHLQGELGLGPVGADGDLASLVDSQRQDAEDTFGIPGDTIFNDLNARLLEAVGRLNEERRRPGMKADLILDDH